jgi:helicase MOV-10
MCTLFTEICSIEIENDDEDLLPEVIVGDFLWLDDIQEDIRYESRITKADVFSRGQSRAAILKMTLRLPTVFDPYTGAQFIVRFRLNRITLRRQYHALASFSTSLRRLLFPVAADIKPMQYLSKAEIDNLKLMNDNIHDDNQQLQTIVSILRQPKGSVPFIIFGPCANMHIPCKSLVLMTHP